MLPKVISRNRIQKVKTCSVCSLFLCPFFGPSSQPPFLLLETSGVTSVFGQVNETLQTYRASRQRDQARKLFHFRSLRDTFAHGGPCDTGFLYKLVLFRGFLSGS